MVVANCWQFKDQETDLSVAPFPVVNCGQERCDCECFLLQSGQSFDWWSVYLPPTNDHHLPIRSSWSICRCIAVGCSDAHNKYKRYIYPPLFLIDHEFQLPLMIVVAVSISRTLMRNTQNNDDDAGDSFSSLISLAYCPCSSPSHPLRFVTVTNWHNSFLWS